MKKMFLLSVILLFCGAASDAAYYNADIPPNAGSLDGNFTHMGDNNYRMWDNKTQTYINYTVEGHDIYGSDGSRYKRSGDIIHDVAPAGKSYYIKGNWIEPSNYPN